MEKTQQRAPYPWETPAGFERSIACEQPVGCGQPIEDSVAFTAQHGSAPLRPPDPPAYVMAHTFREHQVTLMWGGVEGADGYLVLRGESCDAMKPVAAAEQASYIDERTSPGKTYYYAVRAYNEQGQSAAAPASPVTTSPPSAPENAPEPSGAAFAGKRLRVQKNPRREAQPAASGAPKPPVHLHAETRGTRLVELQWQGEDHAETEYRLYRSATPWCSYGLIAETKECFYRDTVPEAGTKYYYFVQAVRAGRASGPSDMAQVLTFPALPPPEPPARLRAAPVNPGTVVLRWPHAAGAAAYIIYARVEGEDFRVVGHTLDGGWQHENAPADISIDYRVQSYHDTGVSEPSMICTVHTGAQRPARPAPPPQNRRFPVFSLQGLQGRN